MEINRCPGLCDHGNAEEAQLMDKMLRDLFLLSIHNHVKKANSGGGDGGGGDGRHKEDGAEEDASNSNGWRKVFVAPSDSVVRNADSRRALSMNKLSWIAYKRKCAKQAK